MQRHPQALTGPGETTDLPLSELSLFQGNARQGDVGAISESLTRLGQYRAIVVNRGTKTGRPWEVLAGNHTAQAAMALGWELITAHVIDVDEDTARRIVLVDNRTNDLASNDDAALAALLLALEGDYSGTAYSGDDLDDLNLLLTGSTDLDRLGQRLGEPQSTDGWPTLHIKVPHLVKDAWMEHANPFDSDGEALAHLLGVEWTG